MGVAKWAESQSPQPAQQTQAHKSATLGAKAARLVHAKAGGAGDKPDWQLAVARTAAAAGGEAGTGHRSKQAHQPGALPVPSLAGKLWPGEAAALASQQPGSARPSGGEHLRAQRGSALLQSQDIMSQLLRDVNSLAPEDLLTTARSAGAPSSRPHLARVSPLSRFQSESQAVDAQHVVEARLQQAAQQLQAQQAQQERLLAQLSDARRQLTEQQRDNGKLLAKLKESQRRLEQQQAAVPVPTNRGSTGRSCGCFGF